MRVLKVLLICFIFTAFSFGQKIDAKFRLELLNSKDEIVYASFSPDGEKILLLNKESTQIWSAKTGKLLFSFSEKIPPINGLKIKWQPNGSKFLAFDSSQSGFLFNKKSPALLFDLETQKLAAVLEGKKKAVRRADWSKDGKRILTFNNKEEQIESVELSVWMENGEFVNSIYENNLAKPQFIDGGKKILFDRGFSKKEKSIVIWDVERGEKIKSFDQTYEEKDPWNIAKLIRISPNEKLICGFYGISSGIICWEADGDESMKFAFEDSKETGDHYFCGFSSDGKRFAVLKSKQNRIEFINSETGKAESFIENRDSAGCVLAENYSYFSSWSPDNRFFITHNGDDKLSFWEIATGKQKGSFKLIEKYQFPSRYVDFDALTFNPTKPILMSASNKLVRLWNLETGEMIKSIGKDEIGDSLRQKSFANWSPGGDLLMTRSKDENAILIWEIKE